MDSLEKYSLHIYILSPAVVCACSFDLYLVQQRSTFDFTLVSIAKFHCDDAVRRPANAGPRTRKKRFPNNRELPWKSKKRRLKRRRDRPDRDQIAGLPAPARAEKSGPGSATGELLCKQFYDIPPRLRIPGSRTPIKPATSARRFRR